MSRIEQIRCFLEEKPKDCFLRHALALELIKVKKDAEAKLLLEAVLRDNPAYVGSYYVLGKLLERIGMSEQATAIYEQGIKQARAAGDSRTVSELCSAIDSMD